MEEPNDAYNGQVAKINFRLADGTRVVRKFRGEDTIEVGLSTFRMQQKEYKMG